MQDYAEFNLYIPAEFLAQENLKLEENAVFDFNSTVCALPVTNPSQDGVKIGTCCGPESQPSSALMLNLRYAHSPWT